MMGWDGTATDEEPGASFGTSLEGQTLLLLSLPLHPIVNIYQPNQWGTHKEITHENT